jgi:2-haloacid dehalogenase
MKYDAIVFDAYGTLFDVHSVATRCEELWPGKGAELSRLWRVKQLEYTWQRSLMRRYEDFEVITGQALRYVCTAMKLELGEARVKLLMDEYLRLATFPETLKALARFGARKLAILSNGSPAMLDPLVRNAGLASAFSCVLSVDALKVYKPDPRVYRLAVDALSVPAANIGFVSSNCWDACGAKSFGFTTFWINRGGAPVDALGVAPDHVVRNLGEVPALLS